MEAGPQKEKKESQRDSSDRVKRGSNYESSNSKVKRCKHGKIIVKHSSKKKSTHSSDPPLDSKYLSNKAPTQEASPKTPLSARLSPSSTDSISSDIYDPEGPIIPISPGDSPPISPMIEAANKLIYCPPGEKNDDDVPSSAVQLNNKEKYLRKLNRQERVVEEVKLALKPYYQKRAISKEQYKDVLRRAVPKICHSKNGEINPVKIRTLVDAYVEKMKRRNK